MPPTPAAPLVGSRRVRVRVRRRRRRRRPVRRALLILVILLVVALGISIWSAWPAISAARDARTQIAAIQAMSASLQHQPSAADLAALDGRDLRLMHDLQVITGAWSFWRQPALFASAIAPHIHGQVQQIDYLLEYGRLVAQAGHRVVQPLALLLSADGGGRAPLSRPALVAHLAAARTQFLAGALLLEQAERARRLLAPSALPSPLRVSVQAGVHRLDLVLPSAPTLLRALATLPPALGADGPRDYLVVPQNSEDLRATGGFIGTIGILHVDHGRARFIDAQDSYAVDLGRRPDVFPPLPIGVHGWGAWYFRDANWSADFPTTARLLEIFYALGTHRHVDGTIAFDSLLLPQLVALAGPVAVPGYHETLTSGNAFQRIDYHVNVLTHADKTFAIAAYRAVFARLLALPNGQSLRTALTTLTSGTRGHDLLLYADDPRVERAIRLAGADGAINRTRGDYLYVVDTNTSYNKVNQLVRESISYHATIRADRGILATATLAYTNTAGPDLPRQDGLPFYSDFVRVYVPAGSTLLSTSGLDESWTTYTVHAKTQFSGYLEVPSHASRTVTFVYRIPANVDPAEQYSLTVQKQPGTAALPLDIVVSGALGIHLGTGTVRRAAVLDADVGVVAPLAGGSARLRHVVLGPAELPVVPGSHPEPWVTVPTRSVAPY